VFEVLERGGAGIGGVYDVYRRLKSSSPRRAFRELAWGRDLIETLSMMP
jgi:hypothetical protein